MKPNRKVKKQQISWSKLDLEEVIGLTVRNHNGLGASRLDSKFVYTAGCVVVLYDVDLGTQSHLVISNRSPKPFTCVAVSQHGTYIAAGESGHQPAIIVWNSATLASISELKCHQFGVACIAFSPDGKLLVSVGPPEDGYLCLWDWHSGTLVKKLKTCSPFSDVASVSFSSDVKFIFTSGKRHVKIWTVGPPTKSRAKTESVSLTMHGKHVNLGHHKGCTFIDIASPFKVNGDVVDDGKAGDSVLVYALTASGVLCVLHDGLTITQSVNLMVEKGYALSTSQEVIACACNNGIVKLYTVCSLQYAGDLRYSGDNSTTESQPTTFPDAIACQFSTSEKLVVVYRDQSLYIWNTHGKLKATKCCVLVSHSGCIWDIKNLSCENLHDPALSCVARGCTGGVSFATCSADGTIRLWDLALQSVPTQRRSTLAITEPLDTLWLGAGTFERESVVSGATTKGYRTMAVSSDGKHLAAGDSDGSLHIFNLCTSDYTCIRNAHEGEVLSLSFSVPIKKRNDSVEEDLESNYFLASSGRDKMIHLFDVNRNFCLIANIDDHSAAVSFVKLIGNGRNIISYGSDRSLMFHDVVGSNKDYNISHRQQQKASYGTIYDIAIDPVTETAVTVGQDKKINILDLAAGQVIRSFKQGGDFGDPIRVCLDPSCSYVVCSYSDRSICMYDFTSGEIVARATGHGDTINGIIFLSDCKHLVSVGSDGCVFVWKVPVLLTTRMLQSIKENCCPLSPNIFSQRTALDRIKFYKENYLRGISEGNCQETPTFRFSISRLPEWAKSKVTSPFVFPMDPIPSEETRVEDDSPSKSTDAPCVNLSLYTPSNHNQRLSPESSYKDSTTQGTCRSSFTLDKRWVTIHTVCLDLLNSPEACYVKGQMVPLSSGLSQIPDIEETKIGPTSDNRNCDVACIIQMDESGHQHGLNDNACAFGEEDFFQNPYLPTVSGTNSAICKPKIEATKLSASKSYCGLQRDFVHGQTLPTIDLCQTTNGKKETILLAIAEDMSVTTKQEEDSGRASSNQQKSNHIASSSSKSIEVDTTTKVKDQQPVHDVMIRIEKNNIFNACIEALRSLDDASKIALEVFSTLRDITSTHPNDEFYAETAEMLPSIAKNVHEIAHLCGAGKVEIPGFESLL